MTKIEERTIMIAKDLLKHDLTMRELGEKHRLSKSVVHFDLNVRLKDIDFELFQQVRKRIIEHQSKKILKAMSTNRGFEE